jgi:hypothetical protein
MTDPTSTDTTPTEPTKITRARATTSGVPRRAPRSNASADVPKVVEEPAPIEAPAAVATLGKVPTPFIEQSVRAAHVEIKQGGADHVEADRVSVSQGGITSVNAHDVDVRLGGIAYAHGEDISVNLGGVALARADRLTVERGSVGAAFARETHIRQGYARSVLAQEVRIDQGLVGTMVTGRATFERPGGVLMLIAGRVDGPVKAIFDWRAALAFGAAFGLVWGVIRRR